MKNIILEVKDITKIYQSQAGEVRALDGISFPIYAGEILSLLGVNGAGKTTLSSILATVHPPTSGDVLFQGTSIYKQLGTYRKALGYCPQRPNLDSYLTVRDNLIFAGRYFLLPAEQIEPRTDELLQKFDLQKYANFNVNNLSGGYRQRLSIARALMHNPRIVILDEPTVGLDPGIRRHLWDVIRELKHAGITVILTTHYLDEAEALSERACIMHQGKILLIDKISALMEKHEQTRFEDVFIELTRKEEA